jgi:hypothetical protein
VDPDACHKLLVDIVYHAIKDWRIVENGCERRYADDDHRAFCNTKGYGTGREELENFFDSTWFYRICDEFVDLSAPDILGNLSSDSILMKG